MSPEKFEAYKFLRLCSIDLDTVGQTLRLLRRYKKQDVRIALVREVAVSYGRPFTKNHGDLVKNHKLSRKYVPFWAKALHDELLRLRNQQFAHTDIKFYEPKVAHFTLTGRPWFPMSFKGYDYPALLAQLPQIQQLVNEVDQNLCEELERLQRRLIPRTCGTLTAGH
jgi:hypothetical protein